MVTALQVTASSRIVMFPCMQLYVAELFWCYSAQVIYTSTTCDSNPNFHLMLHGTTVAAAAAAWHGPQVHDFWHVLFDCHTNVFGELALKALEFVQVCISFACSDYAPYAYAAVPTQVCATLCNICILYMTNQQWALLKPSLYVMSAAS
jgi:hypothetical protein